MKIITWLHDWWPTRYSDWSQTVMVQVDSRLQLVTSHQLIALHCQILSDIVHREPQIGSHHLIGLWRVSTHHVSGKCSSYLRSGQWILIWMMIYEAPGGDVEPQKCWFLSRIMQVTISHTQPHCTPPKYPGGLKYTQLWIRIHHNEQYAYHTPHNNHLRHVLHLVNREVKVSFVIAWIWCWFIFIDRIMQSSQMPLYMFFQHCELQLH